ncbi:hypothetical protein SAMD00019534_054600 [Acytostelium subglobosum LB1]|uniref:hypothetical protein n=1 Tax=Acytostelium subglobosum LB1 TaxID=1410327 RepID=UPI0006450C91|nr:hypothetical protein SAMD00019534_054600 [Acytostelium subglobosum LB1]GAM22285.1 hypothetical protein SAMD00019534_054600 [Acytostelium subglobosum LB1]|eukprot:XP_012754405.1 hypothetical protein SAMD00019534_054600 [Acytostelium subglobosum LB1]
MDQQQNDDTVVDNDSVQTVNTSEVASIDNEANNNNNESSQQQQQQEPEHQHQQQEQQQEQQQQQQQQQVHSKHSVDNETLVKGVNIDETLNKKQKEREERLASMMSRYNKKYQDSESDVPVRSTDDVDTDTAAAGSLIDDGEDGMMQEQRSRQRRAQSLRMKDQLAEEMKKYRDQYQTILSDVNTILSTTPPSLESADGVQTSSSMVNNQTVDGTNGQHSGEHRIDSSVTGGDVVSSDNGTTSTSTSTSHGQSSVPTPFAEVVNFNAVPLVSMNYNTKKKKNKMASNQTSTTDEPTTSTTTSTSTTTTSSTTQQPTSQESEDITNQTNNNAYIDQQHIQQQLLRQQNTLYFETQSIPVLSEVGFKTLKAIEMDAIRCADSMVILTRNLNYSLMKMSRGSVELFNTYKLSNDLTCDSVGSSVNETHELIDKCVSLNEQAKCIVSLSQRIKQIREAIDKLDTITHQALKQLDRQQS